MKHLTKFSFIAILMSGLVFTSCDDNDDLIVTPESEFDGELVMVEADANKNIDISVDANTQSSVDVRVMFTSSSENMKRVYITKNQNGQGAEPFELTGVDNKGDGSLDLEGANSNEFELKFTLPVPSGIDGDIVYDIWATSGKGDHRDAAKRRLVGVGSVTLDYGGVNPAADINHYEAKMFAVPLGDGTSKTFISSLNGELYKLSDGEEFASFWDFGYYWLTSPGSSFASTSAYPALFDHDSDPDTELVAIAELTGTDAADLNNCYFASTTMTTDEFDAVAVAGDLSGVSVSTASAEKIQNLEVGQVVAFMDSYRKKGLIKVTAITSGFGSDGSITVEIKVQP